MPEDPTIELAAVRAQRAELHKMRARGTHLVRRSMIAWSLLWAVAFLVVWSVTSAFQGYVWLWPLALVFAAISVGNVVWTGRRLQRGFSEADAASAELEGLLQDKLKEAEQT
ncbi:MAG: hypothetical protein HKN63_07245 [Rhodobacteraceae bacterium]|nr:hypothetical protein [Paracoccaceae bacterium]